jgi:uncharacterized protein
MTNYRTPGVYIKELNLLPPSVAEVSTAIPVFIGYTQKAEVEKTNVSLKLKPVKIYSMLEYEQYFGKAQEEDDGITVTITDTYANGQRIRRLIEGSLNASDSLSKHNMYYALQMFYANGGGPCYIISVDDYSVDPDLGVLQKGLGEIPNEPTLIVIPEAVHLSHVDMISLYNAALQNAARHQRFLLMDVPTTATSAQELKKDIDDFRGLTISEEDRKFGAAYYPYLDTIIDYSYLDTAVSIVHLTIGNPPESIVNLSGTSLPSLIDNDNGLYNQIKEVITQIPLRLPPSAAMAGIYARIDRERGVWKAPANTTVSGIIRPAILIDTQHQDTMNVDDTGGKSINAIRVFPGKGTLVWGARTLDGNDTEWRYINVRRLFNMIEKSVRQATEFAVFEPNTASTWLKVKAMIESYLYGLWQQGALAGSKPEHAYFVRVGLGLTMIDEDILRGIMRVSVGIAAVRPAEFIEISFSHKLQES